MDAERWEVSRDGRSYTFHLAPNERFHDDVPIPVGPERLQLQSKLPILLLEPVNAIDESLQGVRMSAVRDKEDYCGDNEAQPKGRTSLSSLMVGVCIFRGSIARGAASS